MPQEYKITQVSSQPPREHYNQQYGTTTYYIKVMLEGVEKPVTIGKRRPDALKVGDTVYGRIIPTQYDTDKFQAEKNPAQGSAFTPKDQGAIRAQWAIGQAIALLAHSPSDKVELKVLESTAKELYAMVDRVKASEKDPLAAARAIFHPAATPAAAPAAAPAPNPDPVYPVGDEPINLDDIPF